MEQGYPGHQMGSYPNQQQMWANFYGSGGGPPGSGGGGEPGPRYPHLPPHMGGPGPMEPGPPGIIPIMGCICCTRSFSCTKSSKCMKSAKMYCYMCLCNKKV